MIVFNLGSAQGIMLLQLIISVVLPLVVSLVTNGNTQARTKALLLAGLSVVASLGAEIVDAITNNTQYDLASALITALGTFIVGVAMHFGLFSPTGVSGKLQSVGPQGRHEAE